MNKTLLDKVRRLVDLARYAPNGNNAQPWRFTWQDDRLSVWLVPERTVHALNQGHHADWLNLGMVVDYLSIAASEEGLQTEVILREDNSSSVPRVELMFQAGGSPDPLFPALRIRHTDRRAYRWQPLPEPVEKALENEARAFPNCGLHFRSRFDRDFERYVLRSEEFLWRGRAQHTDFFRWLRLTRRERQASSDGMSWRSLGVGFFESRLLIALRFYLVLRLVRPFFLARLRWIVRRQLKSSAGLYCFTVRARDCATPAGKQRALLEAGRLAARAWLRLNQHGLAVQPFTAPSLPTFDAAIGMLGAGLPEKWKRHFRLGRQILARAFQLPEENLSVWMLRTGIPELRAMRPDAQSKHFVIDEVFKVAS